MSLYHELKRRNVIRVAIAYLAGAWLLIEVTETLFPIYGFSDAAIRLVVTLLAIGFPITLVLSWVYELTPEGLKLDKDIDRASPAPRASTKKLDRVIIVLLALVLGYFAFDKFVLDPQQDIEIAETAAQAGAEQALEQARLGMWNEKSIAVLPFINRSQLQEDEYFTDGMHDELLSKLARIAALKVISRTSVMQYRDTEKSLPEIARELSVSTILEGGVQRVGNQVRINVQLINAHTDEHLWAEIFDRELTAENLFTIQSEISTKIADALGAELSPQENSRIYDLPTSSLEAYNHYLHGRQLLATGRTEELMQALREFEQAIDIDAEFALAWLGVADASYSVMYKGAIGLAEWQENRKRAVETALALDDQLGEVYLALARSYSVEDKWEETKAACSKAIELIPNSAQAYIQCAGAIAGWGPVNQEKRLALYYKAAQLDPVSSDVQMDIGVMLEDMGRYEQALDQFRHLLQTDPGYTPVYIGIGQLHEHQGHLAEAIQWYRKAVERDPGGGSLLKLALAYLSLGDYEAVANTRKKVELILGPDTWHLIPLDGQVSYALWKPGEMFKFPADGYPAEVRNQGWFFDAKADLYLRVGNLKKAREFWLKGDSSWASPDQWLRLIEEQPASACDFAGILTGTGDPAQGKELVRQIRLRYKDIQLGSQREMRLWPILCDLVEGSYERALDALEQQVEQGYIWDTWRFGRGWRAIGKLPWWDPIRDHPRYIAIVKEIEAKKAEQRELLRQMDESGATVP
jgi:TolB-like protein